MTTIIDGFLWGVGIFTGAFISGCIFIAAMMTGSYIITKYQRPWGE